MMFLTNRVALVTGASRGIGRSVALALAGAGVDVAVGFREREAEAGEVVRGIEAFGRKALPLRGDVSSESEVQRMVRRTSEELGPVEVLVSNAGIARALPLDRIDPASWDETMQINLRAAFLLTAAVLPDMRARRWGRLIYMTSTAAQVGGIIGPHYAASKAGLIGMMHAYAAGLASEGITANAIAPALIETEMIAENPGARPDRIPVRRFGAPEEVAEVVVAVVRAGYLTGQTIQVNGGVYMT
jgi:3-oxoacyl-[acyl-carrier protein] reductase